MNNYKEFSIFGGLTSENTVLKSIQFWSTIYVRGVYISNGSFGLSNLPKEMGFKVTDQSNSASNINLIQIGLDESDKIKKKLSMEIKEENAEENDLIESNSNLAPSYTNVSQNKSMKNVSKLSNKKNVMENLDSSIKEIQKKNKELKEETKEDVFKNTLKKIEYNTTNNSKLSFNVDKDKERDHNLDLKETNSEMLKRNMDNINKEFADTKKEIIKNIFKRDEQKRKPLVPDPIMHLKFILGYTATHSPLVKFYSAYTSDSNNTCEPVMKKSIFFASGNTLIKYDYTDLKQKFYFGHSKPIINYVLACEGQILFSCQEGKNSIIRVWNVNTGRCIKMLTTPYEKITSLSISRDSKILCTVGLESYNKEQILLWDISNLDEIKVYIRQSSHFSVNMIKFSPFEQNILVSCGKENIKFWRIKGDHLGGKAVVLNQYARENNFICLDYDNPLIGDDFNRGRVFIGSNKGCVFQVSCNTQELEAIYKIQDSAILSICVNDAFCATGSLDGYLRVWPIDFKEFIIEAKHDSGVCSVDIGYDAIEIVCGTLNGSIGILDIQTKNYKTLLRTPPSKVQLMVAHPSGDYLFTIEDDRSVRVWDVENKSEAFQFISTKDPPTSIGVPNNSTFACGFTSGVLKIFDLDKTVILYETKSFSSAIMHIKYTQNDKILISMNTQGHMSIHDANNNYIQIKLLKIDEPTINTDISVAIQEDYFATIGPESNCAIVWNSKTYGMKNRIPINNFSITKLALINKNLLCVVLENCTVMFFSLATYEGIIIKEFQSVHIKKVNEFLCTKNYKYLISGGEEGIVKIWDAKMLYKSYTSFQQFIGHSNGVRSIIAIEQKSLIVSVSEDSGIHFWNFMGDLTFCETEITQEFEKFGNAKEMKDLTYKNSNSTRKSANIHNNNNVNTIKASHLEKTYKLEHGHGHSSSNKLRINFDNLNEENTETRNVLSILAVEQEDNLGVDLTHTQSLSNTQSQFFSSEAFKTNNMVNITQQHIKELNDKLLFTPKYIPIKLDKL
jgi:WD40 repeat protein